METSRISTWRARAWTHWRLCTLEGFCEWNHIKWILHLDLESFSPTAVIYYRLHLATKKIFIWDPRCVFLSSIADTADTPHSFLLPTFLWNTNQTCVTLLWLFYYSCVPKLVKTSILSQKKKMSNNTSIHTRCVPKMKHCNYFAAEIPFFPQPVFTTTTKKEKQKASTRRIRVCVWVISTQALWASATWARVGGWGAPQHFWKDIFHRSRSSQSTEESFCSKPGVSLSEGRPSSDDQALEFLLSCSDENITSLVINEK